MKSNTKKLVLTAILTALVVVLQFMAIVTRSVGLPFSISLVLVPIVIGAATCGVGAGTWLGFVFGVVVLLSGDAAAFLAVNIPGTVITVLVKGMACGLIAALIYKALETKSKRLAVFAAAIVCPIVNTGVFLLGCAVFFMDTVRAWAGGGSVIEYIVVGFIGINFVVEMIINVFLGPIIVRLINTEKKH